MTITTLNPAWFQNQKSFYGKAHVMRLGSKYWLKSYDTVVCTYDEETCEFERTWSGYSVTTMRHVNAFCNLFGLPRMSKAEWLRLEAQQ